MLVALFFNFSTGLVFFQVKSYGSNGNPQVIKKTPMGEEKWQSTARKKVNVTHKIHKGSCAQHVEPCPANAKKAQSEKPVRGL